MIRTNILKIITLILGAIAIGLGCHAFFTSDFNELNKESDFHDECSTLSYIGKACPPISYEIYFLSAAIAAFVFSILFGFQSLSSSSPSRDLVNAGFHAVAGILVLIGGIMMIVSAVQIWSFTKFILSDDEIVHRNYLDLYDEKVAAGAICLVNGFVYVITAVFAYKNSKNPTQTNQGQVWTTAAVLPAQNYGQQNYGQQNYPPQNYPPQNYPQQNYPPQNYTQNPPPYSASAYTNEKR